MARYVERFSLAGRRALVTGASKGIGLEICAVLADAGRRHRRRRSDPGGSSHPVQRGLDGRS